MKRILIAIALVVLLIDLYLFFGRNQQPAEVPAIHDITQTNPVVPDEVTAVTTPEVEQPTTPSPAHIETISDLEPPTVATDSEDLLLLAPDQQMEVIRIIFRNYGQRFQGNPVGNNAEITAALKGDNPKGVNFLSAAKGAINDIGELVDHWGTPYFFHQLSRYEMEIHSAGSDRIMGTGDDLITR